MNLLSAEPLPPAGDVAVASNKAAPVSDSEQSGDSGFSGVLKSSLHRAEAEATADEAQPVDLNKVNAAVEVVSQTQIADSDALRADQISTMLMEIGSLEPGAGAPAETLTSEDGIETGLNLLKIGSEELASAESGIGLPPVAATAISQLPSDNAAPVATQISVKAGAQSVSPVQVVMSQTAGVANQADLSSGQQGSQSALQQPANPLPMMTSDGGTEQPGVEFKLNTAASSNNQGSNPPVLNTPTVVAAGTSVANSSSAATTPLLDSSSLSLQNMSLGRGESSVDVGNGLAERVQWMVNHKQNIAHIRLDPPMLGKLDVQVKVMDDAATITIQTQQGMTRDIIDAASHRLREALQESGFQNVNVDVSHREDPGQTSDNRAADVLMQAAAEESESDDMIDQLPTEAWINGDQVSGMVDTFA